MTILNLRNLNNAFTKINNSNKEIFYNKVNNNLIIFDPIDKCVNTNTICNGISNKAYLYLINELNINKNLIVYWSQVEGTTSDYIIYYDLKPKDFIGKSYKQIIKMLPKITKLFNYKYVEIKNNKERQITETIY